MRFSSEFINRIYKIGLLLTILLLLTDLLAFFYYPHTTFADIFLATREQTPLTWISSLAMFFIALSCFSVYLETKRKIWYFLAITFSFFSMDDATYFHERISGFLVDNTTLFGFFPSYIWVIIYLPLLFFSLGSFIILVWKENNKKHKEMILTALFILGFAIFLDLLDGFVQKSPDLVFCFENQCNLTVLHLMRLAEEVLEVVALGILGYTSIRKHCLTKKQNNLSTNN